MRILFLGDSLTEGKLGVGYVSKVAQALLHVECINAGVGGDTTLNLLRRLSTDVAPRQPDGVLVMVGVNDAISASQGRGWRFFYRAYKGVPSGQIVFETFSRCYRQLLEALLGLTAHVWAALPPVEHNPSLAAKLREYNAEAARSAAGCGVPALDLMARIAPAHIPSRPPYSWLSLGADMIRSRVSRYDYNQQGPKRGYTYTLDGIHLTDDGAERLAQEIVAFLCAQGV